MHLDSLHYIHLYVRIYTRNELMLMRRARAYSRSCSQVILIYLHPFLRNSLFAAKNRQKSLTPIFMVQDHSRSSMLTFLKSSSPVIVIISRMSVPIW